MVKVARIVPHFTTFLLATKFDSDLVEQDVSKKNLKNQLTFLEGCSLMAKNLRFV
jgi:hypothetical protein